MLSKNVIYVGPINAPLQCVTYVKQNITCPEWLTGSLLGATPRLWTSFKHELHFYITWVRRKLGGNNNVWIFLQQCCHSVHLGQCYTRVCAMSKRPRNSLSWRNEVNWADRALFEEMWHQLSYGWHGNIKWRGD